MSFTDEHIRAAVKTGQYTDPAAEKLLADVLIGRRDKIARTYTLEGEPLTKFALDAAGVLTFENPAVRASVADAPKGGYTATWSRFDNATGAAQPIGSPTAGTQERLQAPADLPRATGGHVKVSIAAVDPASPLQASWSKPVDVYLQKHGQRMAARRGRADSGRSRTKLREEGLENHDGAAGKVK